MKKLIFFSAVVMISISACQQSEMPGGDFGENLWNENYFVQKVVDASELEQEVIRAKVDGKWQEFQLTQFPENFMEWNIGARIQSIEDIKQGTMPNLEGPHNGIIATYGYQRKDSQFRVNNAIKGCGFLPKREHIKDVIQNLEETIADPYPKKLQILIDMYENADSLFDLNKQVSLELYSTPERGTQTFLNQMTDPTSVLVFMAIPTFKLKTIAYLLHPENPDLTDYEKDVIKYINLVHSYFHGEFSKEFIAVIYNVIEVYNSSPGVKKGRGTRILP